MGRKKKDTEKNDDAPTCPRDHALERRVDADIDYECDVCSGDISAGSCFFGCTPCDYSLCNACYIKVATGELKLEKKADQSDLPADCITGARIDPDITELCEHFNVEDRIMLKLNEVMKDRHTTFSSDIEKLWDELTNARSPAGLLMAKIKQIQEGVFVGKVKAPAPVQRVIDRYRLDNDARTKLTGFICARPETQDGDLYEIERRCETSGNPSATVMMCIVKLHKGEELPPPLRGTPHRDFEDIAGAGGGKGGSGGGKGGRDARGDRERDRERDRDRERGGDRGGGDRRDPRGGDGERERDREREHGDRGERRRTRSRSRSRGGR